MKGKMIITAEGEQITIECNMHEVDTVDKMFLIHNIARSLNMSNRDLCTFLLGVLDGAFDRSTDSYKLDLSQMKGDLQ